ncbi:MAG: hypothetical protein AB7I59_24475 [Geminicoccaceae bacterium]
MSKRSGFAAAARWLVAAALASLAIVVLSISARAQSSAEIATTMRQVERQASRAGDLERQLKGSIGKVEASIQKCLAEVRRVGNNPEVQKVLRNITRKPGQQYFNLSNENVLKRLEKAVGRKLDLTEFDLQTCVSAYDLYFGLQAHTDQIQTGDFQYCPSGATFCEGTVPGAYVCCSGSMPVCAQSCDEDGDCEPYCEPSLSCFPAEATVAMADGTMRRMDELRIGDRVAVMRPDGTRGFDEIYLFAHKDAVATSQYLRLTLASGRELALSPRHFIPVASDAAATWQQRVVKAANEVGIGDVVWYETVDGATASAAVTAIATEARTGLFNPLTLGGTILVDGVAASAHSDWFLDGVLSPAGQDVVYQAMFLPVRALYRVIGPEWTETIAERWGVVDAVRDASPTAVSGWLALALALMAAVTVLVRRRRRAVAG